jgi:S-adenosylmethionine:tRNA ribosyltransferase-isomerase
MRTDRLHYELPAELIAQAPAEARSASRLLVLDRSSGRLTDSQFAHLGDFLRPGDCLVLNDTKVLPARFFLRRHTGAALEGLFLAEREGLWEVMLKGSRKVKPGESLQIKDRHGRDSCTAELIEKKAEGVCLLKVEADGGAETVLETVGFPPLPPYIRRDADPDQAEQDRQRYQTVYARRPGAVAAPTAGLHFTEPLLNQLREGGIRFASVTLHVGTGTFKPVAAEELEQHDIHSEWFQLDRANAETINAARAAGGRIIAVGTTATRVLETVAADGRVQPAEGDTNLFITPGYRFRIVDAMITNFHLPKSTLLALVAAFAGLEEILAAYHHAIAQRYRFYSYGDATLIL